jgi:hypothetical protein
MSQQDESWIPVVIGFVAFFFAVVAWKISTALGADWAVTFKALIWSVVYIVGVGGVLWWLLRPAIGVVVSGMLVAAWSNWWSVLESMAKNRSGGGGTILRDDPFYFADSQQSFWWNDAWFKWGIEVAFIIILGYFLYQKFNDR